MVMLQCFECATVHNFQTRFLPKHSKLDNNGWNLKPLLKLAYFGNPARFYSFWFIWIIGTKRQ